MRGANTVHDAADQKHPVGAEATSDLAVGHGRAQFALTAVIVAVTSGWVRKVNCVRFIQISAESFRHMGEGWHQRQHAATLSRRPNNVLMRGWVVDLLYDFTPNPTCASRLRQFQRAFCGASCFVVRRLFRISTVFVSGFTLRLNFGGDRGEARGPPL